jgi:Concanavalin A-like lectin/glucanases superfamily
VWKGNSGPNHVYRYEGGTNRHDCGQFGPGYRILSLASVRGDLYASDDKGFQYRYDGDNSWTPCGDVNKDELHKDKKIFSTMAYQGKLFGGSSVKVLRYEGDTKWDAIAQFDSAVINQIHTLGVWQGRLFAGTWPEGKVVTYQSDNQWEDCGNMGIDTVAQKINEINELTVYNGKLYAGALPKGEVWRYDGEKQWVKIRQLVQNPEWDVKKLVSWNRVPCMTVFQGKLYAGTSTCHGRAEAQPTTDVGKVFSWEAGKSVSYDDDLGTDWKHVVAIKSGDTLRLFIDGKPAANSSRFDVSRYMLSNQKPLLIGFGAKNYFAGHMGELRIYKRALGEEEIDLLAKNTP